MTIPNIELFPKNIVRIYNRSGKNIYEKSGYNNTWEGFYNGEKLPSGPYYFIIEFNDSKTKSAKGWIYINY